MVGVIGHPISHSLSPLLHNAAFDALGIDWVSVAFPVPPGQAAVALRGARALGLAGLSVTMPHKSAVAALVDEPTALAARLEAVNCVVVRQGRLLGENTDGAGFLDSLERGAGFVARGRRCLVVGAGGAARAVVLALREAGAREVAVVNRNPERARLAAALAGDVGRVGRPEEASGMDLVVDATPVGMGGGRAPRTRRSSTLPSLARAKWPSTSSTTRPRRRGWPLPPRRARPRWAASGCWCTRRLASSRFWTGRTAPVQAMWDAATMAVSGADRATRGAPPD